MLSITNYRTYLKLMCIESAGPVGQEPVALRSRFVIGAKKYFLMKFRSSLKKQYLQLRNIPLIFQRCMELPYKCNRQLHPAAAEMQVWVNAMGELSPSELSDP